MARQRKRKALCDEDELSTRGYHHGAFVGGEDLFLRAGRKIGVWVLIRFKVGFEPGVFSAKLGGVELCKGLGGCVVSPCGEIHESQRSGGCLIGCRRVLPLTSPINATVPGGGQIARSAVSAEDLREDVQIELAHLADVV